LQLCVGLVQALLAVGQNHGRFLQHLFLSPFINKKIPCKEPGERAAPACGRCGRRCRCQSAPGSSASASRPPSRTPGIRGRCYTITQPALDGLHGTTSKCVPLDDARLDLELLDRHGPLCNRIMPSRQAHVPLVSTALRWSSVVAVGKRSIAFPPCACSHLQTAPIPRACFPGERTAASSTRAICFCI
jgi:hypothetical protein